MGFLNSLFGDMASSVWTVAGALLIVLVLIVFLVWALKFVLQASRRVTRSRNGRIGITESVMVDSRRQLVLVRRDDVEHLLLTGGPQDVILEANIPLIPDSAAVPSRRNPPTPVSSERPAREAPAPAPAEPGVAASARPRFAAASSAPLAMATRRVSLRGEGGSNISPIERLRELGKRPAERGVAALRYPGLLRPVTRHRGVSANKAAAPAADSDMSRRETQESARQGAVEAEDDSAGATPDASSPTANRG